MTDRLAAVVLAAGAGTRLRPLTNILPKALFPVSADYLAANLAASGGASVVGEGARVEGELVRSVVWPGGVVHRGERLVECIRVGDDLTVAAGS